MDDYVIAALLYLAVTGLVAFCTTIEDNPALTRTWCRAALLTPVWPLALIGGFGLWMRWLWRKAELNDLLLKISTTGKDG